jgi:chaperonin cofactor prefoldin
MRDLQMAKNRQNAMEREVTITRSTASSIETVADGVPLYRSVGKAFMFQTKDQVLTKLGNIVGR